MGVDYKPRNILGKNCFKLTANIYKSDNLDSYQLSKNLKEKITQDFSIINLFRYESTLGGSLLNDHVFLNDSLVATVTNSYKKRIKIDNEGRYLLKVEKKKTFPIP